MPSVTTAPVEAFMGICPATKMKPPHLTACEYGPTGFGAFSVKSVCFGMSDTPLSLFSYLIL
jgi:hypothetical protein